MKNDPNPYKAILQGSGGDLARLEAETLGDLRTKLGRWLYDGKLLLEPGDTIRIIDTREET